MQIDKKFIELISSDSTLNKEQFKILGQDFPAQDNWNDLVLEKEVSRNDANLLMLLKGKLALKAQEQIIKNYHMVLEFNNIKIKQTQEKQEQKHENIKSENINTQTNNDSSLKIYCDGACSGNPGEAGSGVAVYSGDNKPILFHGNYVKNGTNNIAELNALYKALLICNESQKTNDMTIYSDSKYSIDCITTWAYGWKSKGWTKKGGEIKNLELIKSAHELYEQIKNKIEIKHVKGHAGIEGNELADRMAVFTIKAKNSSYEQYSYSSIDEVLSQTSY